LQTERDGALRQMNEANEQKPSDEPVAGRPEFRPAWFWAFVALMLHKLGGMEAVTIERLEQFDIEDCPEVYYDGDAKAYVMKLKDKDMPARPVFVPVGGKILKRQRKILRGKLS